MFMQLPNDSLSDLLPTTTHHQPPPPITDIMDTDIDDTLILLPHAVDLLYLPAFYGRIGMLPLATSPTFFLLPTPST